MKPLFFLNEWAFIVTISGFVGMLLMNDVFGWFFSCEYRMRCGESSMT